MKTNKIIKTLLAAGCLTCAGNVAAQQTAPVMEGWLNHLDVAVTGGTGGLGFDIAAPVTEWAQLRIGGEFRPFKTYHATFGMEMAEGMTKEQQAKYFSKIDEIMMSTIGTKISRNVKMSGDLKMNNFKFLVDIFPIKKHRNFHVTVGFYYGNNTIVEVQNTQESVRNLAIMNSFNSVYRKAIANESLIDFEAIGIDNSGGAKFEAVYNKLLRWGMSSRTPETHYDALTETTMTNPYFAEYGISVPVGAFNHDIIAPEDIYWDSDEYLYNVSYNEHHVAEFTDGTYFSEDFEQNSYRHRKGELRYRKGEVVHKAGDKMRVVPDDENLVNVTATTHKFKPYIGVGYSLPITGDNRTQISVDAGLMFWGGKPSINFSTPLGVDVNGNTVYYQVDLVRELNNLPKGVQYYVDKISNFPVFPEVSLRISQRLW